MGRYNKIFILFVLCLILEQSAWGGEDFVGKRYFLGIESASRLALENSYDIQLIQYDHWIDKTKKDSAESVYDLVLTAEAEYQNNQRQQSSTIFGSKTLDNDYNVGFSQQLPTGTNVGASLENNRHWTDSTFTTSPLTHDSTLGVTITQDLGKNLLGIQNRGNVKVALLDIENSRFTSLEKIERTIALVQKAYWDVVLAKERVSIEQEMLQQAEKLYEANEEKLQDKAVELPETIASQANFEKRKNDLRFYENDLDHKQNILKLLLNVDESVFIDTTEGLSLETALNDSQSSLKNAFENRRDYKRFKNEIQSRNIQLVMERKNLWPEINLTASLEKNGLGDHFKQAITQISEEDNPDFFAGISIDVPLQNRKAKAQFEKAKLQKSKALVDFKLFERTMITQITSQAQTCAVLREVALHNETIAQLQVQKLLEEERRLAQGRSETDTIIRFQEDLIQAKWGAALAKYQYLASLIDLKILEGTLLTQYFPDAEKELLSIPKEDL